MDKLSYNILLQILYFIFPFIFVIIFGAFQFVKNPVKIRRFTKGFFILEAIFLFLIFAFNDVLNVNIFNCSFNCDKKLMLLLFVSNFLFLLVIFLSKSLIKIAKKLFYLACVLLYGLLNIFIISDNVIFSFVCLFWLILSMFFISDIMNKKTLTLKESKKLLIFDIGAYFVAGFFICFDFLRYFILNETPINFSYMSKYFAHIDDRAILISFIGFLILMFKCFGFLNLFERYRELFSKKTFFNASVVTITESIIGICLLYRIYNAFDYLFYQYQTVISSILLLVIAYNAIASFKLDNLLKTVNSVYVVSLSLGLYSVFSYSKTDSIISFYYFLSLICSYAFILFVFAILENLFNAKDIDDFKRINDKSKKMQFFTLFGLLNFAKAPVCSHFVYFLMLCLTVNSIEYDCAFLKAMPYLIILCIFLCCISVFNIIAKILIDPLEIDKNKHQLFKHQNAVLIALIVFMFILLFGIEGNISNMDFNLLSGNIGYVLFN